MIIADNQTVSANKSFNLEMCIKNIGSKSGLKNFDLAFNFGTGGNFIKDYGYQSTYETLGLGEEYCFNKTYIGSINSSTKFAYAQAGEYNLTAYVDFSNSVVEANEFNNSNVLKVSVVSDCVNQCSANLSSYGVTQKTLSGNLVKVNGNAAIYLVKDGKRYSFPNQKTYESWYGKNFSSVETITQKILASYQLAGNVTYKPGTLVKLPTVPKVYLVTDNGNLRWITTKDKLNSLGLLLNQVKDLSESFFLNYTVGTDI